MSSASRKFIALRESGYTGAIDNDGNAVMTRTDGKGKALPLFKGGTGTKTPDDNGRNAGRLARNRRTR